VIPADNDFPLPGDVPRWPYVGESLGHVSCLGEVDDVALASSPRCACPRCRVDRDRSGRGHRGTSEPVLVGGIVDRSALPPPRLLGVIVPVCVAGLGVTCTAAVSFAVTPHRASTPLGLVALLLASTLADRFPVPVEGVHSGRLSLSFVFGVASIVLFGWPAGLLVVILPPALTQLLEQRPRIRIAYNVSVLALAATAAGARVAPTSGHTGPSGGVRRVGPGSCA